jgi:hypothetical protein
MKFQDLLLSTIFVLGGVKQVTQPLAHATCAQALMCKGLPTNNGSHNGCPVVRLHHIVDNGLQWAACGSIMLYRPFIVERLCGSTMLCQHVKRPLKC